MLTIPLVINTRAINTQEVGTVAMISLISSA